MKPTEILERPIAAGERLAAFLIVSVTLLVAATILIALPDPETNKSPGSSLVQQAPVRTVSNPGPRWERSARGFLEGYLRFAYGKAEPKALSHAGPGLRERLVDSRHRVSPAARERSPEVESITAEHIETRRVSVLATIEDGEIEFPIELVLTRSGDRWLVVEIGEGH